VKKLLLVLLPALAFADEGEAMGRRVQELLRAHQADVFGCVAAQQNSVEGEMLLRVFVGDDNKPGRVDVLKNGTNNGNLEKCLTAAVRGWDLASLKADRGDQLVFPLAFQGGPKVAVDKVASCDAVSEQAFFVTRSGGKLNGSPVRESDLLYVPSGAKCKLENVSAVRVRWLGPAATGALAIISKPSVVHTIKGGAVRLYLDGKNASFAVNLMTIDAGVTVPPHKHEGSDEVIYLLSGKSRTTVSGQSTTMSTGDLLRIPAGAEHTVTTETPIVALQVYAPGGPEQRFKQKP
jgi:quercetin dioxygenase-like cupin family protein